MNYYEGFSSYLPINLTMSSLEQPSAQEQQFLTYHPSSDDTQDLPFSTSSAFLDDMRDAYTPSSVPSGVYVNNYDQDPQEPLMKKIKLENLHGREIHQSESDMTSEDGEDDSVCNFKTSSKKGKKYQVYTEEEKLKILTYLKKYGVKKTIEHFSTNTRKLTQRKLRCWTESQRKVKESKGRKLEDPAFDQAFLKWCLAFKEENGRAPNNKEAKLKALSMSETAHFKASKGWLRRFAARHKFTFSAVKNFKKKPKKRNSVTSETKTDFSVSTTETFLNSVDLPQLGDEFFNFEESPRSLVNTIPTTHPVKNWNFDGLHHVLPKEDFDVYSFLKFDGEVLETDTFQNPTQQLA